MNMDDVIAVDTETFYDKKHYSVSDLGNWGYTHDPRFDCYMVTVAHRDWSYAGPPAQAPWERMSQYPIWLSHNKGFDHHVIERCHELGLAPGYAYPKEWHCTANMSAYLLAPRYLAGAAQHLLGRTLDKGVRDDMNGVRWEDAPEELKARLIEYAKSDASVLLELWEKHSERWPQHERELSQITYEMGDRGVLLNVEAIDKALEELKIIKWKAEQRIPWVASPTVDLPKAGPLSRKGLFRECAKLGIAPPPTLKKDDTRADDWLEEHAGKVDWVLAVRTWRRVNTLESRLQTMKDRVRSDNGRMPYSLFYFGAQATGRWAGAGGVNMQNLVKAPWFLTERGDIITDGLAHTKLFKQWKNAGRVNPEGVRHTVDVRSMIVAPPGKKLLIADLAQIEARCVLWFCRDWEALKRVEAGESIYETHARTTMGWTGGELKVEDAPKYALAKARCVGGGTLVLTDSGYKPIVDVCLLDRVYDGIEFVSHGGVVRTGYRQTVDVFGDRFTEDHEIFIDETGTRQAREVCAGGTTAQQMRESSACSWKEVWQLVRAVGKTWAEAAKTWVKARGKVGGYSAV